MTPALRSQREAGEPRAAGQPPRILVIDDAEGIRGYLATLLELRGYGVDTAEDGRSALTLLESGLDPDLVLLDIMLPGVDGLETLRQIRAEHSELPVVMLSVVGQAATIVEAMRAGARDFLTKPCDEEVLLSAVERVLADRPSAVLPERGRSEPDQAARQAIWHSPPMARIRDILEQISDTDVTVLIQGESGVGKEIVARAVHRFSARMRGPFVKVNCAALPEELLESELFGYEKGSFTGAHGRKQGKFEVAHRGTIFLDEIGEMSPGLQAKLLQVLQDSEFTRLGGHVEVKVDVRVVCATHRPLVDMVREGRFREDLFFRLNVVNVEIPPLRERRDEIPRLVEHFLTLYSRRYERPKPRLSRRLQRAFERYAFPGNVRELENMIKRLVVLESEETLLDELQRRECGERRGRSQLLELLSEIEEQAGEVPLRVVGRRFAQEAERETIEQVLQQTEWNRKQAAKLLNVSYKTLLQKIRECGLEAE